MASAFYLCPSTHLALGAFFGEPDFLHLCPMKEGNVLFNDTLNTFYLRLYGVTHMVKDHSDSERGNLLPPHGLLFPVSSKGSFICIIPQTGYYIPQPLLHQWCAPWKTVSTVCLSCPHHCCPALNASPLQDISCSAPEVIEFKSCTDEINKVVTRILCK